jgi:SAM-dependent methyltransferase
MTEAVNKYFGVSTLDIATCDKIPVIWELMHRRGDGLALDIGIGTGYTTHVVLGEVATVCLDAHEPNLRYFRDALAAIGSVSRPVCIVADACVLPFRARMFRFVLCSEVLEHLSDHGAAVREIARVLADNGRGIITVPYTGLRFSSFLELLGIPTVHDYPGPEQHARPGYDFESLRSVLGVNGLEIEKSAYFLRLFTRLMADVVSLVHIFYQGVVLRRRAWAWCDTVTVQWTSTFRVYRRLFPVFSAISRLDRLLHWMPGFGLAVVFKKRVKARGAKLTGGN